jgi:hypothetical protein
MLQVSGSISANTGEGEGRGDDLVVGPEVQRYQRDEQCLGAAGDRDAVLCAGEFGQPGLELAHLGAHDVLAVVEHALDARVYGRLERRVLALQVDEVDRGHGLVIRVQRLPSSW